MTSKAHILAATALATALLFSGHSAVAQVRTVDSSTDKVGAQFSNGSTRWIGGWMRMAYNPAGQPANLSTEQVVAALQVAMARWSEMCNLDLGYAGLTDKPALPVVNDFTLNIFGWQSPAANWATERFWGTRTSSNGFSLNNAQIVLNTSFAWTDAEIDGELTNAVGFALGLDRTDVVESVMFRNPAHSSEYKRTLRGDDAAACAALYGASADAPTNRTLNWAEQPTNYGSVLHKDLLTQTGHYEGYTYRGYQGVYAGSKNGNAYFMGPNGVWDR